MEKDIVRTLGNDELFKKIGDGLLVDELKKRFDNMVIRKNLLLKERDRVEYLLKHATDIIDRLPEDEGTKWVQDKTNEYFGNKL